MHHWAYLPMGVRWGAVVGWDCHGGIFHLTCSRKVLFSRVGWCRGWPGDGHGDGSMAKSVLVRASLVRAALLGTTALAFFNAPFIIGEASAKVGITSAADGSPLGKPPNQNERVLRIGIDIQ